MKLYTFKQHLKESLKDHEFKKLWKKSELEYQISRLETSSFNPSLDLLKRVSVGLGSKINVQI